jgi:hypothetical protein
MGPKGSSLEKFPTLSKAKKKKKKEKDVPPRMKC